MSWWKRLYRKVIGDKLDFEKAMQFVFRWEGGYVNDKHDPGGETKFGISKRAYPNADIKNLTIEQAKRIYEKDYWIKGGCHLLDWPLSLVHFDACVNHGIKGAEKLKERAKKKSGKDGLDAEKIIVERERFYRRLSANGKSRFLRGWLNRMNDLREFVKGK